MWQITIIVNERMQGFSRCRMEIKINYVHRVNLNIITTTLSHFRTIEEKLISCYRAYNDEKTDRLKSSILGNYQ